MAKDAVATMGEILPDEVGGRDAVHVAVISAEAARPLNPGANVGRSKQSTPERLIVGLPGQHSDEPIGIVDPFLKDTVKKGQRFWLYLYPRTITSLRHNWTHPAFADVVENAALYIPPSQQVAAKEWIRGFCDPLGVTYDDMIEATNLYLDRGQWFVRGGAFEGESIPNQYWIYFERATGRLVDADDRESFFSCSC